MKRELGWINHIIMRIWNSGIWKYECGYVSRTKKCGKCSKKSFKFFDPNNKHLALICDVHDSSLNEVSMIQIYTLNSFPTTQCIDKR